MLLQDHEKIEVENLLKIIRRAKFDDFHGLEALALARAYAWLESLTKQEEPVKVIDEKKMSLTKAHSKEAKKT